MGRGRPSCSSEATIALQSLEQRVLMSISVPALSSLPSARVKLFLDFDGDVTNRWGSYSPGATPAYDQDGNATSFSSRELASIREIWGRVAEKYSPFKLDVTTVDPGTFSNGRALKVVLGGRGSWMGGDAGGMGHVGSFTNSYPNSVFVFTRNLGNGSAHYAAEAAAHEAAHAFGLEHQARWSGGRLVDEYNSGSSSRAPIMGSSYDGARGLWWLGPTDASAWEEQDDLALLASAKNGFGYRADDHAALRTRATPMTGAPLSGKGIIERTSDVDSFAFSVKLGAVTIAARPYEQGGMLDVKLTLRRSSGTLVAMADSGLGETITKTLTSGSYVVEVASHGGYGDIGQYTITMSGAALPATGSAPSGGTPAAPKGLVATAVSSSSIRLNWQDLSGNESGFRIERSSDRAAWTQVAKTGANARSLTVTGLKANQRHYFRVRAYNAAGNSRFSKVASATTTTFLASGSAAAAIPSLFSNRRIASEALALWDSPAR